MNPLKIKLLSEMLSHLDGSQGMDLKSMMDQEKNETPMDEAMESPDKLALGDKLGLDKLDKPEDPMMGKPKGISIEKLSLMGDKKPMMDGGGVGPQGMMDDKGMDSKGMDDEMSDDELEELLKRLT